MRILQVSLHGLLLVAAACLSATAQAQVRARFPGSPDDATIAFQNPGGGVPFRPPPAGGSIGPVVPPGSTAPGIGGATLQPPTFDPYATSPGAASSSPSLLSPPGSTPYGASPYGPPASGAPYGSAPYGTTPYSNAAPGFGAPSAQPYGAAGANPYYTYPNQPPAAYPSGLGGADWWSPQPGPYLRLFSDLRMRYTWLAGDTGNQLDINDVDFAGTVNFPNFLCCEGAPLRISPGFSFHFWDGPDTVAPNFADLPPQAYSTYLDARWDPRIGPIVGAELGLNVGIYTDFNAVNSNSIRVQGVALLVLNLTPTVAIKGGIEYLDRVNVKMLPAFGLVWQPNPQTRWDVYFPRPKLAQYLTTVGTTDLWWYLGGEYGGGSWTIQRLAGSDQADINDIRLFAGIEWNHQANLKGFFEVGYVFDRKIEYRFNPANNLDLSDTIMLRAGISF